ncbi:MAG: discoidin domain-containing protein [Micromonosporaceae bacterium]
MRGVIRQLFVAGTTLALAGGAAVAASTPAYAADPGPPLRTPASTLQANLACSSDLATPAKTPILLVTGTIESARQSWSWGYQKVLREQRYPVCVIKDLPNDGTIDAQTTVEHVVHAIRYMRATSGRKISTIGHSQGGMQIGWALRHWPDLPGYVDDAIALDSPFGGTRWADVICGIDYCPAFAWQASRGSNWVKAMRRYPIPHGSFTSIGAGKGTDLVVPSPDTSYLPGAKNLVVQQVCANRTVSHLQMLSDAPVYALVMDALTHAGPADVARTGTASCARKDFAGVDQDAKISLLDLIDDVLYAIFDAPWVGQEPPLRDYAVGKLGDTNIARGRPATASSTEKSSLAAGYAVDGRYDTRWASAWYRDPAWIYVDLGAVKTVNGVQVSWERAYATDYLVAYWDGGQWVTAYHTRDGDGGNDFVPLAGIRTRYVAVQGNYRGSGYGGYSIWELTVAGS